jgi:hydroxymethylpyrimidine/phosphomethylpyrimidine kinase
MLPMADILTPNKPEAELLSGMSINSPEDVARAAERLYSLGAKAVLIKGGHFKRQAGQAMIDWLCIPGRDCEALTHPRVATYNNHGTGCTLSSAIATYLAFGLPLKEAVQSAQVYLNRALATSFNPGIGVGPPNFMC